MACPITTLQTDACANGFMQAAQNEVLYRTLVLQLLCNGLVPPEPVPILGEDGVPIHGEGDVPIYFS